MNIIALSTNSSTVTGGQVYDASLYRAIESVTTYKIKFYEPKSYREGVSFNKLMTPFLELSLLKKIKNSNICFMNSSSAYRFSLLLILTRIFLPKVKIFVIHHHYQYEVFKGIKKTIFKFFELNFLRFSSSIIIPNPYVLDITKDLLPKNKIDYIETSFKDIKMEPNIRNIRKGDLLYIGTIEYRKGLHLLLDSLFLLKQENEHFTFNIVGDITDENYYKELIKKIDLYKLEKQVIFHGRVSIEKMHNFLNNTYIFVFPSLLEGYGRVIIEAMSYSIPVIAFNNSAMPYTIKDGYNGFLAKNKNPEDFKRLIKKIINNSQLHNHLSKGALLTYNNSSKEGDFMETVKTFISTF
jgi:glycosyltransferase involved in cell wall biosynthesis